MNRFLERSVMAVVLTAAVTAGYLAIERAPLASVPPLAGTYAASAESLAAMETAAGPFMNLGPDAASSQDREPLLHHASLVPPRRPDVKRSPTDSVMALADWFVELDYDLEHVREGRAHVPEAFLASLPPDLSDVPETETRKRLFFQAMLPLVLRANQEILNDRRRLWQIRADQRLGRPVAAEDRLWLAALAERYKVSADDIDVLIRRVDVVPPSMALAQAAEESGWGTSRFARQGNAMFGQWTTGDGDGLVPEDRDDDKDHKVRRFDTMYDSVRAYMRNLNTHRAYRELRRARAVLRRQGNPLNGVSLAGYLHRYSERGDDYVASIRAMIEVNGLQALDDARLMTARHPEA